MRLRAVAALVAAFVPVSLSLALAGAAPPAAAQDTGWIRWGNWSPSAPDFDIYLNSFGGSGQPTVIKHVRYGHISSFTGIPAGQYAIAMRKGGAAATSPPMLSASVHVAAGTAYTIVSMGAASHLGVQVLTETMRSVQGEALIRVVQESVHQHSVTVSDGSRTLGGPLQLGSYTGFLPVSPGRQAIRAVGFSETSQAACASTASRTRSAAGLCRQAAPRPVLAVPRRVAPLQRCGSPSSQAACCSPR